ncbi:MAG: hypothetical protein ACP5D1_06230 [Bacteroidales bacterium]
MKVLRIITLLSIMLYFSIDAYGVPGKKTRHRHRPHHHWRHKTVVSAPLDSALLIILGAAGVTYFASRKRKNNKPEA